MAPMTSRSADDITALLLYLQGYEASGQLGQDEPASG